MLLLLFRDKIRELQGEIERLEDSFEFSHFADIDNVIGKLNASLDEAVDNTRDIDTTAGDIQGVFDDTERQLG